MLRITPGAAGQTPAVVKLEGKLLAPWIEELRQACRGFDSRQAMELDLTDVTYVDAAGSELLKELMRHGIKIHGCSRFVAELLHLDTP